MGRFTGVAVALMVLFIATVMCVPQRGIQLRLTQKGLGYTIKEAVKILQEDLQGKHFNDFSGDSGGFKIRTENLIMKSITIGSSSLTPDYSRGLRAAVSSISTSISGKLKYEKRVWGIKIRDTVNIDVKASGVSFSLSLYIGRQSNGHPSIGVNSCNAHVGGLNIHFSGSRVSWLYNLFSSFIERKLRGQLADIMCKTARESISKRATEEMNEFKVKKAIDEWAILDYSLTAAPKFDYSFMDVYIKGEFIPRKSPSHHSSLPIPSFSGVSDNSKMLYIWVTDFTLNTAGEVYHNAGFLHLEITDKSKMPPIIKSFLNTRKFRALIPELARRFPNRPIQLALKSYKAPKFVISKGEAHILIYAAVTFQVVLKNGKLYDAFVLNLDIKAGVAASVTEKSIKGDLKDFSLTMKVAGTKIGPISLPVRLPLIQNLVKTAIMHNAKKFLNTGFPLPNLDEVHIKNPEIVMLPNVIRIAADCLYVRKVIF
eukprot:Seg1908.2 transcript_id=Seg1908.2/GoldUCD/mRNA.D3Y31 product="Lipopolysaccharide-binding protein" protein_id=Seg1908.2/GoldUCD/D3Y31